MKILSISKLTLLGLFLFMLFSSNECSNKEMVVSGKIFPAGMTVPMRDVAVNLIGSDLPPIISDGNGFFKIDVSAFPVELEFSKETYKPQIVKVKKPSDITVYMKTEN